MDRSGHHDVPLHKSKFKTKLSSILCSAMHMICLMSRPPLDQSFLSPVGDLFFTHTLDNINFSLKESVVPGGLILNIDKLWHPKKVQLCERKKEHKTKENSNFHSDRTPWVIKNSSVMIFHGIPDITSRFRRIIANFLTLVYPSETGSDILNTMKYHNRGHELPRNAINVTLFSTINFLGNKTITLFGLRAP